MEQQGKVESRNHQKLQQETTATMIDLSFLTEEEQESIRAVLKRDADLKRVEEKRIQNLQSTVADKRLLKYLTGEWFYKAKQHRHQDRIHGSDIIRASMRKTNKPLTLLELCNMPPERSSFVSSENRDVIIPPVLSGILEVPEVRTGSDGSQAHSTHEAIHSPQKTVSPSKLRNNPFNQFMDADADKDLRPQADVSEVFYSEPLTAAVSSSVTAEKESDQPAELETEPEEDDLHHAKAGNTPASSFTKSSPNKNSSPDLKARKPEVGLLIVPEQNPPSEDPLVSEQDNEEIHHNFGSDETVDTTKMTPSQFKEVRSPQLSALQNTPSKEALTSLGSDVKTNKSVNQATLCSEGPSHVEASSQDKNRVHQFRLTGEKASHEDVTFTEMDDPLGPKTLSGVRKNSNQQELRAEEPSPEHGFSSQAEHKSPLPKDNGTFRANLVLICEKTDGPSAGSDPGLRASGSKKGTVSPEPCPAVIPVPPPTSEEESPGKISELRHFWERKNTPIIIISRRVTEEAQTSPDETSLNPNESLKGTDLNHVYPEQLWFSTAGSPGGPQPPCHQEHMRADTGSDRKELSPEQPQRSKGKDEKVRRSPSKTYNPKVLPLESSSTKGFRLEGSPLKTFPTDIDPKVTEHMKPATVPGVKRSPVNVGEQTDPDPRQDLTSLVNTQRGSNTSALADSKQVSENLSESSIQLTKALTPQKDLRHQGKVRSPSHQDEAAAEDRQQGVSEDGNSGLWSLTGTASQDNPGTHGEISSPNSSALKRLSSRNMMSSKSLEELTSQTTASLPTVMKTSFSTLGLQKKEMDSDSLLQKTPNSSMSNLSLSSGMASLSSVSSSMTSVHTIDSGGVEVQGTIQFAVNYIQKTGELQIFVVLCRGLVIADVKKNRSDPYVKCYLLPDKTRLGKRKSSVRKKTVNPTYNEILKFKVTMEELKKQNLNISVWHNDPLGRNSFLGEVGLDLSKWDFNNTELNEYILKSRASAQTSACPRDKGQMRVGLRFVPHTSHSKGSSRPEAGELLIWVKDCRNLPPSINPFVKCTVLPDMSQKSRQQTRVVKNTANPMFNHTMVYDGFQPEDLKETCVELTVWDHVRLKNHFVGGVRLGPGTGRSYGVEVAWMDSAANEVTLWHQMLRSNGEWVEDVLPLRMLVMAKRMSKSS
ncbi:synaptotagmin-like protein 2 isoform X1 [Nothobranchius furzeri]|uniref:Transcript variant X1 n=2 Tax=Nothobranchius furzeri TaxID=105023 RepID=A0A9D2XPJ6_NOTFU|nr:synaptotagmin-like protein 2 isoform X2 [Nothobranchius furzeri]KAF7205667.1 transcript variant X1 [Nothobranchius furzeri]